MMNVRNIIAVLLSVFMLAACHNDETELFTDATLTLAAPEGMEIVQTQGNAVFTNINNSLRTSSSEWDASQMRLSVERGSYSILVEGRVRCRTAQGEETIRQFRAHTDFASMVDRRSSVILNVEFL